MDFVEDFDGEGGGLLRAVCCADGGAGRGLGVFGRGEGREGVFRVGQVSSCCGSSCGLEKGGE